MSIRLITEHQHLETMNSRITILMVSGPLASNRATFLTSGKQLESTDSPPQTTNSTFLTPAMGSTAPKDSQKWETRVSIPTVFHSKEKTLSTKKGRLSMPEGCLMIPMPRATSENINSITQRAERQVKSRA